MSIYDLIQRQKKEQRMILASEDDSDEKSVSDMVGGIQSGMSSIFGITDGGLTKRDYLKAAKGWIYACVNVIAEEIASTELFLKQFKGGEVTEVDDHPVLDLIYRANNVTTKFDLIKLTFQYLEQTGEAPWFLSFKNGKPDSIILLRPERLTVLPGKDGELVGGYTYKVYGTGGASEIKLEPFEVVPLRYTDPDSPLRGKGPLQAAQETVDIDNYSEKYNKRFYQNSAMPNAALETDKVLAKDVRARLEKKIKDNYEGYENSHKTMILENGLKWTPLAISQKDMDFIEQQKFSRDKIFVIFRVPPTVLGLTADVTRANAEATDYVFSKRTIKPKLEGFIQQLNEFLVPLFDKTGSLYLAYKDPVPENTDLLIRQAQTGVQSGYMTINEARELLSLDPIEGGDELRDPLQFAPIQNLQGNTLKAIRAKKIKISKSEKFSLKARSKDHRRKEELIKTIYKTVAEKLTPIIYDSLKKKANIKELKKHATLKAKAIKLWTGTPEEMKAKKQEFQSIQLRVGESFEPRFKSQLATIFNAQKLEALKEIENGATRHILDVETQKDRYAEKLTPLFTDVIRKQSRHAFELLGQDNELLPKKAVTRNQKVATFLKSHPINLAIETTRTTNELLASTLSEGVSNEESIPELKKRVSALFEEMEQYRSERIARTEVIFATNFATEEAYVVSEVVEAKEWLAFIDGTTDEDCLALDGEVRKLGQSFGSVDFPPIHPNCRCTLIPVVV